VTITDIQKAYQNNRKLTMVTGYDSWSAQLIATTPIDMILVGDSASMVMHGYDSTLSATMTMMEGHVSAVARHLGKQFLVADLPFLAYRKSRSQSVEAVHRLMQLGAHAVKLEGVEGNIELIQHLVQSGVPVMGHLGLTPQFVQQFGGYRVQGRSEKQAEIIRQQAQQLQQAGCFSLVLECVPAQLAKQITAELAIPTIGIGAGADTSGQVLVLHDLLGLQRQLQPKFVKRYLDGFGLMQEALTSYHNEVQQGVYPAEEHSYAGGVAHAVPE
jgi:3-methyl-2-oxobutanoate hydroxymethyltransferase